MKKISVLLMSAIVISLLSGCGDSGKKLTCSYDITDDGSSKMEIVLNFDKKGEKTKSYTESVIRAYTDETSDEDFSKEYEAATKSCDNYKEIKGVKCDASKDKKTIRLELKVNMSELDDKGKELLNTALMDETSYDDMKSLMESSNYTCK